MENEVKQLYLDDIIPNRFQPRENFDEQALKELAVSIKEHGVIQPIVVRQIGEKYEIIAGERRYKASTMAGLTQIPAIVKNLDDKESSKVALIENLQRRDLTPIEEARTYQKILELDALTQEELARTMGKSQSAVSNKLRLLTLTEEVQDALLHEQISERHARSLLNVTDPAKQVELLNKVINSRMTVRELDQEIKNMGVESVQQNIITQPPTAPSVPPTDNIAPPAPNIDINPTTVDIDSIRNNTSDIVLPDNSEINASDLVNQGNSIQSDGLPINNENQDNNILPNDILSAQLPTNNVGEEAIGGSGLLAGHSVDDIIKPQMPSAPNTTNNLFPSQESPIPTPRIEPLSINNGSDVIPPVSAEPTIPTQAVEPLQIDNISGVSSPSSNQNPGETIKKIKDSVATLKDQGSKIDIEEFDFDDFYQFVIRVNKQ